MGGPKNVNAYRRPKGDKVDVKHAWGPLNEGGKPAKEPKAKDGMKRRGGGYTTKGGPIEA